MFADKSEGLPPEQYATRVLGLDLYDIKDRVSLNNHLGSLAQHRECYYGYFTMSSTNPLTRLPSPVKSPK